MGYGRLIYNILSYTAMPFAMGRLFLKGTKNPDYLKRIGERLGKAPLPPLSSSIWLHAVSVGEVQAALPLIREIKERYPHLPLVITTTTPTGSAQLRQNIRDIYHSYIPYDVPWFINRFLRHINPGIILIMETEIWPNLLFISGEKRIPIFIINARISPSSLKNYRKIKGFMQEVLQNCTGILVQSPAQREHFLILGCEPSRVAVTGNIKFDIHPPEDKIHQGLELKREIFQDHMVWIGASTHRGEEEKLLLIHRDVIKKFPHTRLLLVPRHPERFSEVYELCRSMGFKVHRRSNSLIPSIPFDIYLGDSMGELFMYYAMSDIAFVGGSLVRVGGHNLLEPGSLSLPIITGPYLYNFMEISKQYQERGALLVGRDEKEVKGHLLHLLESPQRRKGMGLNSKKIIEENKGALEKIISHISPFISKRCLR